MSLFGSLFPKNPQKQMNRAERLASEERWPEAIELLEQSLRRVPPLAADTMRRKIREYSDAYLALLEEAIPRLLEEKNREKAEEFAEIAASFTDDEKRKKAIRALVTKSRTAGAEFDDDGGAPPEEPDPLPNELIDSLLHGYIDSLEPDEKEEILQRSFAFQKAFVLWHQGMPAAAARAAEEHLSKRTDDAWGHLYLGLSLANLDETDRAALAFEAAIGLDPGLITASLGLAAMERRRENLDRSVELLERVTGEILADPDRFGEKKRDEVFQTTLQVLVEARRFDRAEELYGGLREKGLVAELIPYEARLAEARGDRDGAIGRWEYLLKTLPAGGAIMGHSAQAAAVGPEELEEAADFFHRDGDEKRAVDLYKRAALDLTQKIHFAGERIPISHLFRLKKKAAFLLIESGRASEAEQIAEELERLDPVPPVAVEIRKKLGES